MTNRLELFRQQIAAFDGAGDPGGAIDKGYYIKEPRHSSTQTLFKRISLRPQSKNLLIGGIGSGKTTQLLRLQQLFQETPNADVYPHYVDVTQYTQSNDIQDETLDVIIGLELIKILRSRKVEVDSSMIRSIEEYAYGYTREIQISKSFLDNLSRLEDTRLEGILGTRTRTIHRPGVLSSKPSGDQASQQITKILSDLNNLYRKMFQRSPYFLFDGLDRLDEAEKFMKIASPDLLTAEIGFVIIGASSLLYSSFVDSLDSVFNHLEYRSAFDVERDEESYRFFEDILAARSIEGFFEKAAVQHLVHLSGGLLRDLINLTQEAIQEAYLDDAETIAPHHVKKAVTSMGRAKLLGLNKDQYDMLKSVGAGEIEVPTSPEEVYLLSSGRILEYRFPQRRFALHPVLQELLRQ
jgi:energy-coupling factor transporter ATP-binding protein EcfA2